MASELVSARDIYNVIHRSLGQMDEHILQHGEFTAYLFYNMLKAEGGYTDAELIEYTLIGMLHDIGLIKTGYEPEKMYQAEIANVWAHSVYGFLFLRYLSPVGDKADIVLYHHLPYAKYQAIKSNHLKESAYLNLADKMAVFLHMQEHDMGQDYFVRYRNVTFSEQALQAFQLAQKDFNVLGKMQTLEYEKELEEMFGRAALDAKAKQRFLEMLIYAFDFRSQQTVFHTISTKAFAVELGRLMRVTPWELQILYYGSLLHDIGKNRIPLEILEAPRRLNEEEMKIMQMHVTYSEQILRGAMDERIVNVAARHHEKLDGTGYPKGLKGDELNKLERITAVADILSALYGKRSYKDSFPPEKIKGILQSDADNGKICPQVVSVAISNFDTIIRNYEITYDEAMERYKAICSQYESIYDRFRAFET